MGFRLGSAISTAVTLGFGFITLLGLLISDNLGLLSTLVERLFIREITTQFILPLVTITIAITVLIGIFNLLIVHLTRILRPRLSALYSLILIVSYVGVLTVYGLNRRDLSSLLIEDIQITIESALAGLLLFALIYGAATVTRRRSTWTGMLFVAVILTVLLGAIPISQAAVVSRFSEWIMEIPVNAGARGILLGIALATVVTGARVLIGQDRSYRE